MRPLMYTCGIALLSAAFAASASAQNTPTAGVNTEAQSEVNFGASRAEQNSNPEAQLKTPLQDRGSVDINAPADTRVNVEAPAIRQNQPIDREMRQEQREENREARQDVREANQMGLTTVQNDKNIVVQDVTRDSAAARLGLRRGDRIVRFNDQQYDNRQAFEDAMYNAPHDSQTTIVYERGGQQYTRTMWLGDQSHQQTYAQNGRVITNDPYAQNGYQTRTTMKPVGDNLVPMAAGTTGYMMQSSCGCSAAPAPVVYPQPIYPQADCGCGQPVYNDCGCDNYRHRRVRRHHRGGCCW